MQVSLTWLLAKKPWIVPIPGTRSLDHLDENWDATELELTTADVAELEAAFAALTVHGGRMNEAQMEFVD